jgi:hypothetical protein
LKAGIDTRSPAFNQMIEQIERVAIASPDPILLLGPTGAGKSHLARRIYELKRKRRQLSGEFIAVNCATLRGDDAMSALFGHIKGAYTGAASARRGYLDQADGGVLFLDEIGELGADEQAMLLSAIEDMHARGKAPSLHGKLDQPRNSVAPQQLARLTSKTSWFSACRSGVHVPVCPNAVISRSMLGRGPSGSIVTMITSAGGMPMVHRLDHWSETTWGLGSFEMRSYLVRTFVGRAGSWMVWGPLLASLLLANQASAQSSGSAATLPSGAHQPARDQAGPANQAVYLEIGGNGGLYSLNYERYLNEDVTFRVGAMFLWLPQGADVPHGPWAGVPMTLSFVGKRLGDHALELGGGVLPMYDRLDGRGRGSLSLSATAVAGYRYAPADGGYLFRAGLTPHVLVGRGESLFVPWAGVSFGYRF